MLRYYPSFAIIPNLNTQPGQFTLEGRPYSGKYYQTVDGEFYTGPNPQVGPSEKLEKALNFVTAPGLNNLNIPDKSKIDLVIRSNISTTRIPGKPNTYYPQPTEDDYKKGYVIRYFTKKENEKGFITEINEEEYNNIVNGLTDYDISLYQTTKILWKLTGPLKSTRTSQYNVIPGIIDTNQRLTESANKTFLGIVDFIGGEYAKYARPTM
jgi:hypothetical protein